MNPVGGAGGTEGVGLRRCYRRAKRIGPEGGPRRPGRARPREVLLAALLFIVLASGLYYLAPWVLPVRILEGPLVQQTTGHAATLVWYTTRPCEPGRGALLELVSAEGAKTFRAECDGCRQRVVVSGLEPGQAYPYEVNFEGRTLAKGTLHTNKPAGQPFSFIVFGDSGKGTRAQYLLAGQMESLAVDFILHTGDLVYPSGEREGFRDRFFGPYRELLARVTFWPSLGNHDIVTEGGAPYFEVFELPENGPAGVPPERHYWFDYAAARVVVIDSNAEENELAEQVAPWLVEVFRERPPRWRFVVLHHPPYTAGAYKPDERVRRALVPAFEAADVDVVFAGHDHMYERTRPLLKGAVVTEGQGVVYVVSGAGGARLYEALPIEQRPAWLAALDDARHSFTYVQVSGETLHLQQIDVEGEVLDDWTLVRSAAAPAATAPAGSDEPAP